MNCINLRERFGRQHRIEFDPAYSSFNVPREKLDPWMMEVPCQRGVIFPYGGDLLAAEVDGRTRTRKRLRELECTTTIQAGDEFLAVTFSVERFAEVAAVLKPRRRRQVSEAERHRLRAIGFQQNALSGHETRPVSHLDASA